MSTIRTRPRTDRRQPLGGSGLAPIVGNAWPMPEIYLAGQGVYNDHRVRATLVDATGAGVASDQIVGIVRTNDCVP